MTARWLCLGFMAFFAAQGIAAGAQQQAPSRTAQRPQQSAPFAQESAPLNEQLTAKESSLREQVRKHPQSAPALYELALVLRLEHKPQDSLTLYTQAAALQKPGPDQLRSVALDYVLLNDYEDAIHWLRVALGMDTGNVEILYSLGRCYYTQNNFPQARAAFQRVLQLQPDHLKAEENLGLTYDAENEPRLAEQTLRLAVLWAEQRHLKDEWPYIDLGTLLLEQARTQEALPLLTKAAEIAPDSSVALERQGRALLDTGSTQKAVAALQKAATIDPRNPKIHFELGRAYRNAGEAEKAQTEFSLSRNLYGAHNQD